MRCFKDDFIMAVNDYAIVPEVIHGVSYDVARSPLNYILNEFCAVSYSLPPTVGSGVNALVGYLRMS